MTDSPISLDIADGVASIGLNRPADGNAIDLQLARALVDVVAEVASIPDLGAVVLFGEGEGFCVGGDLKSFASAAVPGAFLAELADTAHQAILGLRSLRPPVISAVHGACAGGGLGFAFAADVVLADRDTRFRVAYTAAGLSPDCGVSWTLTRVIGAARANELILTNRVFDAVEAERIGLVSRVVDPGAVRSAATTLARSLAGGPRQALAASADLVRQAVSTSLEQHLKNEADSIASLIDTPDGAEGVAAFLEKRRPQFGRPPGRAK